MKVAHYFETSAVNVPAAQHNIAGRTESSIAALRKRQISQRIMFACNVDTRICESSLLSRAPNDKPHITYKDTIKVASRRLARLYSSGDSTFYNLVP